MISVFRKFYLIFSLWLLAILLLVGARLIDQYMTTSIEFYDPTKVVGEIRKNISQATKNVGVEAKEIRKLIEEENLSFATLLSHAEYPAFVYENNRLVFWNSTRSFPTTNELKTLGKTNFFKSKDGSFIQHRSSFNVKNKHYEVVQKVVLDYAYSIKNQYLKRSVNNKMIPIRNVRINSFISKHNFYSFESIFLFSVDFLNTTEDNTSISLFLVIFGFLLLFYVLLLTIQVLLANRSLLSASILLGAVLLFFCWYVESFTASKYANLVDYFGTMQADQFLTLLVYGKWALVGFTVILFIHSNRRLVVNRIPAFATLKVDVAVLFASFMGGCSLVVLVGLYQFLVWQYSDLLFNFNIESFFVWNWAKVISLGVFALMAACLFVSCQLLVSSFARIRLKMLFFIIFLVAVGLLSFFQIISLNYAVAGLFLIYLVIVYVFELHVTLQRIRYVTYLYFFLCVILVCFVSSIALVEAHQNTQRKEAQKMASQIMRSGLQYDEQFLFDAANAISADNSIYSYFFSPILDKSLVADMLKRKYLEELGDKYDIKIYLYDTKGYSIEGSLTRNYYSILNSIRKQTQRTSFKNVFRQRGEKSSYFIPINLRKGNSVFGFMLLEVRFKKLIPFSIYPALLLAQQREVIKSVNPSNYAIYDKGKLVSSFGNFNYFKNYHFIGEDAVSRLLRGFEDEGQSHRYFQFADQRGIIISNDPTDAWDILANFSFLFMGWAVFLAIFILGNTFYYKINQVSATFTTKIQLFVNFAFFIPLVVVCTAVFYIITGNYRTEINQNFISKAESASSQLLNDAGQLFSSSYDPSAILVKLLEVSKLTSSDLNFYDPEGLLVASTQPKLVELGLQANYVNPNAMSSLFDEKESLVILKEQIGRLSFNTVYYKIKAYDSAKDVGVISISFFSSGVQLEQKIIDSLKVVLSIFTMMFIAFLIISFGATRILTSPLVLLTKKIKATTLMQLNQPLQYDSKDEIGLLVKEYNLMLLKLEESKMALSANDKEFAWREMAKQVAHEIKNPLTPIKLTLQNMQRRARESDALPDSVTQKSIESMLEQIENLTEIADSFATFTQMPVPKMEQIDVKELISKAVFLFQSNQDSTIDLKVSEADYFFMGDEKLLNRIVINLLKNAIESRAVDRKLVVTITMQLANGNIELMIKDNGIGIAQEDLAKVFQPNFSTKYTGSGIGLAVVKKGLEQMHGSIRIDTVLGQGTAFFVTLNQNSGAS